MNDILIQPLTQGAFAPYGDILTLKSTPDKLINQGLCGRHHDLAAMDFGPDGRAGVSLFDATPRSLPYVLELVERHPEGSQAFIPMAAASFLVIVAEDEDGKPGRPRAFLSKPLQGINFHRGVWHGVLTPLEAPGIFAVVDRIGTTPNLEEIYLDPPYVVVQL